jgi:hypothetical protein
LEYGLLVDLGWILMDEPKLEVGSYVSGGFGLKDQEHEQRAGRVTYLPKGSTREYK